MRDFNAEAAFLADTSWSVSKAVDLFALTNLTLPLVGQVHPRSKGMRIQAVRQDRDEPHVVLIAAEKRDSKMTCSQCGLRTVDPYQYLHGPGITLAVRSALLAAWTLCDAWVEGFARQPRLSSDLCDMIAASRLGPDARDVGGGFRPPHHLQLLEDRRHVVLNGLVGEPDSLGDLAVGETLGDELEDVFLATGKAR
jgi:hypothetical protein